MKLFLISIVAYLPFILLRAEETDIIELSQRNPLKMSTAAGPARYGDVFLAEAVDGLSDIPHPWTIPMIIALFEKENASRLRKLQQQVDRGDNQMWGNWESEEKRCKHLITLLGASRDPRAAVVLGHSIDNPSLAVRVAAWNGLYYYFLSDPKYHQLPPEKGGISAYTNFLPEMRRRVMAWWDLNKDDLQKAGTD